MAHYKDGKAAALGDIVRGRGILERTPHVARAWAAAMSAARKLLGR